MRITFLIGFPDILIDLITSQGHISLMTLDLVKIPMHAGRVIESEAMSG